MHYIVKTFDVEETELKILCNSFSGTYNKQCKKQRSQEVYLCASFGTT